MPIAKYPQITLYPDIIQGNIPNSFLFCRKPKINQNMAKNRFLRRNQIQGLKSYLPKKAKKRPFGPRNKINPYRLQN